MAQNLSITSSERIINADGTPSLAFLAKYGAILKRLEDAEAAVALAPATYVAKDTTTNWAAATGTATRTTFATGSVTLPQLAERVKAMIDDDIASGVRK
jgi:hypothetical protein